VDFINAIKQYYAPSVPHFFLECGPLSNLYCEYPQSVFNIYFCLLIIFFTLILRTIAQSVANQVGGTFINIPIQDTSLPVGCGMNDFFFFFFLFSFFSFFSSPYGFQILILV
jgi:hypothetical protein